MRETVDRYQYRYQVRNVTRSIYPPNHAQLRTEFGFNVALLLLADAVVVPLAGDQTHLSCWTTPAPTTEQRTTERRRRFLRQSSFASGLTSTAQPANTTTGSARRCFVETLERRNGRTLERRERVVVYPQAYCQRRIAEQGRMQMFFAKSTLCAGRPDERNVEIVSGDARNYHNKTGINNFLNSAQFLSGAPLHCLQETATGYRYVQRGMLSGSVVVNRSPHLFTNLSNYRNWIEKQLMDVLQ